MTVGGGPSSARVVVEVHAGLLPGEPEPEHTRRWAISSANWEAMNGQYGKQSEALANIGGQAAGYAGLLMLQPDRFNWVRTEWIYL